MDALDLAIHGTAHEANGGLPALARQMGVGEQVLRNKVCPTSDTHKLNLREALAMMLLTHDTRILECLARELDCTVQPNRFPGARGIVDAVLHSDVEHGDVARSVMSAISDGKLTEAERAECQAQIAEAIQSLQAVADVVHRSPIMLRTAP
ncbi:Phage regulatory protein CII [Ferriphaselus amnicola]|uniref:Phage regulatory protein CII n=1 Tax=Ferriphaselus amnicola TaxID=1188319 RepID=A0A2Z6GC18_9PROT|nr:phage regulatory CII family protein [Ferriphaselus amnicola]BBE51161.1 Phage regulatory protein CII [Ferriphaselus amnicola]